MSRSTPERDLLLTTTLPSDPAAGVLTPADIETWCASHAGAAVDVWLGGASMQPFVADPSLPLRPQELGAHARGVLASYLGDRAVGAPLAPWRSGTQLGVCLATDDTVATWQAAAARHRIRTRTLRPFWLRELLRAEAATPSGTAASARVLLVVEGAALTRLDLADGVVRRLEQHRLEAPTSAALQRWQARELPADAAVQVAGCGLRDEATAPLAVPALPGVTATTPAAAPAAARSRVLTAVPDFVRPSLGAAAPRAGIGLAVAGLLALVVAGVDARDARTALDDAAAAAAAARSREERRSRDLARPAAPEPALRIALAGLAHPWGQWLADLEAASRHNVRWRSVQHDIGRGDVRIAASAADPQEAVALIERLSRTPGWHDLRTLRLTTRAPGDAVDFEFQGRYLDDAGSAR